MNMNQPPKPTSRRRSTARLVIAAAFVLLLTACGGDPIPISAPPSGETASQARAAAAPPVGIADTDLGQILVNDAGMSLYGFTDDTDGLSTCDGGCANAWPPVLVASAQLPAGLDAGVFSVIQRTDGTHQLKAGVWPLYLFAGDTAPGQTTGHLSGDVWFLATPGGGLIGVDPAPASAPPASDPEPAVPQASATGPVAPATIGSTAIGQVLVNDAGLTLYGFTNDVDGLSTCDGGCAEAWPPLLVPDAALPAGLDANIFSVVARADGQNQLKAGRWPLYLFAGDTIPGQTTGHLSGDVWFAIAPSGGLIDGPGSAASEDLAEASDEEAQPDGVEGYGYGEAPAAAADVASSDAAPFISTASTDFGEVLVDQNGWSLYGFTNDVNGASTCTGGCAESWPPVLVESGELPAGLDASIFSVVARNDGYQLKAGAWPLYRFAGDTSPGQTSGHLSGDVWFLAAADGKLIGAAEAAAAAQPVAPTATPVPPAPTPAPIATATPAPTPVPAAPPAPAPTSTGYGSDY